MKLKINIILVGVLQFSLSTAVLAQSPWATSGSNIYNTNSGNVGIATMTPTAQLEITSSGTMTDQLRLTNTTSQGRTWAISGGIDGLEGNLSIKDQTDGNTLGSFYNNTNATGVESFRVGPASGTLNYTSPDFAVGVGESQGWFGSYIDGNNAIMSLTNGGTSSPYAQFGAGWRNQANTAGVSGGYMLIQQTPGADTSSMSLWVNNGSYPNPPANIYISSTANVGIGTINPQASLDVPGTSHFGGATTVNGAETVNGNLTLSSTTVTRGFSDNVTHNLLTPDSMVAAWAVFIGTEAVGTNCPILGSRNVSVVSHPSTGHYTVNFSIPFTSAWGYVCAVSIARNQTEWFLQNNTTTSIDVVVDAYGTGDVNTTNVWVMCAGGQ